MLKPRSATSELQGTAAPCRQETSSCHESATALWARPQPPPDLPAAPAAGRDKEHGGTAGGQLAVEDTSPTTSTSLCFRQQILTDLKDPHHRS